MGTKLGQLAQELATQNPWWRDPRWRTRDLDLLEVENSGLSYRSGVLSDLSPGCLYLLRGPRRVGKTVAIKQLVEDLITAGVPPTAIVRAAVDGWSARDLRSLTQNTALPRVPSGQPRYWLLDEVTSVTGDWATQVKWMRDNDSEFRSSTVVLTGSSATGLTEASGQLAGRRGGASNLDRTLMPMGFRTFVQQMQDPETPLQPQLPLTGLHSPAAAAAYQDLLPWLGDLVPLWEQYLSYGGYPLAVAAAHQGRQIPGGFVEDIFNIVANDAFIASRLGAAKEMALLERLWETISSFANMTKVADDLDIQTDAVTRHVEYLRDSYLLWQCPQKGDRIWAGRPKTQDKIYAVDPIVARLPHLRNAGRQDIDPTVLSEMQLGNAIRRRVVAEQPHLLSDDFLFHKRTPTRKEIDFVCDHLGGVAIEGKYTEGSWRSKAATVNASEWAGILATRNVLDTSSGGDRAWAVPAAFLAFLLDT